MMLMGLTREIEPGEKITLHLTFAKAGEITTEAEARTQKRGRRSADRVVLSSTLKFCTRIYRIHTDF